MDYCNFSKDSDIYMYKGANDLHVYLSKPFGNTCYYSFSDINSCFGFLTGIKNLGYKIPKIVLNMLKK
jgi:hypothetical protein